jgi:pSer/pThr/pTyr-binding forkhead associated (FHA) protein
VTVPAEPLTRDDSPADPEKTAVTPVPPTRPAGGEAYLVHIAPPGSDADGRHRLGPKPVVVGRDGDCGVADPHPSVSRRHAIILLQADGRFLITDLGSTNGTFVNDARVDSAVLADGDRDRVGSSVYRFLAGGAG